jgi:leucyl aminopeptidase
MSYLSPLVEPTSSLPIFTVAADAYDSWLADAGAAHSAWLGATGFAAKPGTVSLLPGPGGALAAVVHIVAKTPGRWGWAGLPGQLPPGVYHLDGVAPGDADFAALSWALAHYKFDRYKTAEKPQAKLVWPEAADRAYVAAALEAIVLVRDLINTPASDMGPAEIAAAAKTVAAKFAAPVAITDGAALERDYPLVHAVGMGSYRRPCLIDFSWGDPAHPKVTLVGKGVAFDTGGLDIKGADNMLTMKKDMGGAAHVLGLAQMIMALGVKVHLRVLIPAVENSVSGRAFRPLDVIKSKAGLTVEIGNTDAEGRLILADALTEACAAKPDLVFDFATLTGAARVALGPDVPAVFCNDDGLADDLAKASVQTHDPLWRLPLYQPYAADIDGKVADLNNIAAGGFAGAIYAGLFLERFVTQGTKWAHFDVYGWNAKSRPGRPEGGEAFALHACFDVIRKLAMA